MLLGEEERQRVKGLIVNNFGAICLCGALRRMLAHAAAYLSWEHCRFSTISVLRKKDSVALDEGTPYIAQRLKVITVANWISSLYAAISEQYES